MTEMDKQHILREIARTTAENGGVPFGSRRFATETGIRSAEWHGKYWARWSDALREAGFSPNQLREAYDTPDVVDLYSALTRELGRLPTASDLRLKDRGDKDFPSLRVFERIGTKSELVALLRAHALERGHDDIVALCDAYAPPITSRERPAPTDEALVAGSVYLMQSGRFFKIGRSNAAGRREYEIALQLPEKARTLHVIQTDDPAGIEAYWHRRFETKRKNGEWFDLAPADVAAFKRRKFM